MIEIKNGLSKKDSEKVRGLLMECYNSRLRDDFYITKNNLRLFIKDNLSRVFSDLRKGDKIFYSETGIGLVVGYADHVGRKYVRLMSKDLQECDRILQNIIWNVKSNLFAKVKKTSPLIDVLKANDFVFFGDRGSEILFGRKAIWEDYKFGYAFYNQKYTEVSI